MDIQAIDRLRPLRRTMTWLGSIARRRPTSFRMWHCGQCGLPLRPEEAWLDDEGPLCKEHGLPRRVQREIEILC
jgi:hypothetical protein